MDNNILEEINRYFYVIPEKIARTLDELEIIEVYGIYENGADALIEKAEDFKRFGMFGIERTKTNIKKIAMILDVLEKKIS